MAVALTFKGGGGGGRSSSSSNSNEQDDDDKDNKRYTVKPVLNGISRDQNIFPLKPRFRLIKVHYIQYKKLNQDMQTLTRR